MIFTKPVDNPAGLKLLLLTFVPLQEPFTVLCVMFIKLNGAFVTHSGGTEELKAAVLKMDTS